MPRFAFASAAILALAACSSGGSTTGTTGGPTITMMATDSFGAANITVAAGSTITVINNDTSTSAPHTATSEAAAGDYDGGIAPGGFFFDTGDISAGSTATITVPAGIASGTVQPFFCKVHKAMMTPSDPTITIK